ncbi:MAG: triose-phosphate isomerase [Terriglobales bacterium]
MQSKSRKPIMAGNWKMYKTPDETTQFFQRLRPAVSAVQHCYMVVAAPFVCIPAAVEAAHGLDIGIAGQNLHWEKEGAYTGEISGRMLAAAGCTHVIVGHSERRQYFGETDETVNRKVRAALEVGLTPIVCVGETLAQREAQQTEIVLRHQFERGLWGLSAEEVLRCVIAYEPVWAIGTGRTATPEIAQTTQHALRQRALVTFGGETAGNLRILYGGSVKPDNVKGLMSQPDIDGALVGGASVQAESFAALVNY